MVVPQTLTLAKASALLDMASVIADMDDIDPADAYSEFCEVLDEVNLSQYRTTHIYV